MIKSKFSECSVGAWTAGEVDSLVADVAECVLPSFPSTPFWTCGVGVTLCTNP